jgi:hypothetical protein
MNFMKDKTVFLLVILIVLPSCSTYSSNDHINPPWMYVDKATKTVLFDLVAGWDGSNNAYNYNGYYAGGATLRVPDGWSVDVNLSNQDGNAPHNIIVTYPYTRDDMPDHLSSDAAALRRAYTEDVYVDEEDVMKFVAKEGEYWFFCGIKGHGINDMWINFEVSKSFLVPEVVSK